VHMSVEITNEWRVWHFEASKFARIIANKAFWTNLLRYNTLPK